MATAKLVYRMNGKLKAPNTRCSKLVYRMNGKPKAPCAPGAAGRTFGELGAAVGDPIVTPHYAHIRSVFI